MRLRRPRGSDGLTCWIGDELAPEDEPRTTRTTLVRLAVIGRPNVGKSSSSTPSWPRARDRLRRRGHDARRDRHPIEVDGAHAAARRHRGHPAAPRRSRSPSSTTRRCAPSGRPSAPTSPLVGLRRTTA
jgi:hypothetical protein